MLFNELEIGIKYRSNINNIPRDFLIPVLGNSKFYKRAVGFFSTSALIDLSLGIFKMAQIGGKIQIICSPRLSSEDLDAINLGYKTKERVFTEALDISLTNPINIFEEERLNLMATLIAKDMLEIKLAFMETETGINVYHEKIAVIFDEQGNRISYTGSMNETDNGFVENFESIYVFCDWKSNDQRQYIDEVENDFDSLWSNNTEKIRVIDFPQIIIEKLKTYQKSSVNYKTDYEQFSEGIRSYIKKGILNIPKNVELKDYQKEAINKWAEQSYRGIYDMATGTGKTFTALGSIVDIANQLDNKLAVFIVCPYIHLVNQWAEDVEAWGMLPIIAYSGAMYGKWYDNLVKAKKRFKTLKRSFICIVSNATFTGNKVQEIVNSFNEADNVLFVVDEAHYFGAEKLSTFLPQNIKYRLALSATLERYGDEIGTHKLFDYFGEKCIEYPLERAIKEGALVPYYYHPILVNLTDDELDEYKKLSKELTKYLVKKGKKVTVSESGKYIAFKRSRLVAGASNKLFELKKELVSHINETHILVYCGATSNRHGANDEETERQILQVQKMIGIDLGMVTHKFTAEENAQQREDIKKAFASGAYQVLTAIKCLDEGVNIPAIKTAYILASSQNPKEFIQRRGRVLRKSPETGKKFAIIYDFVTLPRPLENVIPEDYKSDKSLVSGEIIRMIEFAQHSLNEGEADSLIEEIKEAYGIDLFNGDDWEQEEEIYE